MFIRYQIRDTAVVAAMTGAGEDPEVIPDDRADKRRRYPSNRMICAFASTTAFTPKGRMHRGVP